MSDMTTPEFERDEAANATSPIGEDFAETEVLAAEIHDASEAGPDKTTTTAARPRTRWAGIVWGTVFAAVGLVTMLIVTSPDRRAGFGSWAATLTPGGFVVMGVLALGCLILVLGLLAAVRRLQRRRVAS
ncbi:hypothetical protein [Leifsonia sp. Root112D2]|uniref:hypothetical protein n=1 Tax=Leifsonia sp. Root112D2 TaxID=1736426 RepID=UPI0006F9B94D|nr:hypothetical protein [Leifsonia sp. Root112D2]KQV06277.1 hypothetical protein ASC63_02070 [Leifsonia sp. Root112D2]